MPAALPNSNYKIRPQCKTPLQFCILHSGLLTPFEPSSLPNILCTLAAVYPVHRDSAVTIATGYGLDGSGIESRLEAKFSAPVQTSPGAHPASYTLGTGFFFGVRRLGHGVNYPLASGAEVKERVELYLCFFSLPLWQVVGWTLSIYLQSMFIIRTSGHCLWSRTVLLSRNEYRVSGSSNFFLGAFRKL